MPICVVDQLEVINVNDEQGNGETGGTGPFDRCRRCLNEGAAKRQLGEVIDADREYLGMARAEADGPQA
jgi:hypothetical protein